ncbi:AraC family transcriptional regulator [Bacillus solitudinis]|uniref:AraC family transcriptional regulator n=1 Tax=Bacillus solitudinis TaxID=2014074 RepID=UPI000C244AC9|nr:AraC family transcriptional regulator [Bacillus solitudinis]
MSNVVQGELLDRDLHPTVMAYYFKQWLDFQMDNHTHDGIEIMYVICGTSKVTINEESFEMKKGDLVILDATIPHRLHVEKNSPCRMLNVEFIFTNRESAFPSIRELAKEAGEIATLFGPQLTYFVTKDTNDIFVTLKSLVLELDRRQSNQQMMIQLLLAELLIRIARLVDEKEKMIQQPSDLYVKKTIDYIHQNYDCEIQVKDIAAAVNLHSGYLHRIFKANVGQTIMEYLTELRMSRAKMLLMNTDIPIIEISDYVGINSRQYFSTVFKKYTGKTPNDFRKEVNVEKRKPAY